MFTFFFDECFSENIIDGDIPALVFVCLFDQIIHYDVAVVVYFVKNIHFDFLSLQSFVFNLAEVLRWNI